MMSTSATPAGRLDNVLEVFYIHHGNKKLGKTFYPTPLLLALA
jgi:hypothetical protein